jgi:dienelactone hydrolase
MYAWEIPKPKQLPKSRFPESGIPKCSGIGRRTFCAGLAFSGWLGGVLELPQAWGRTPAGGKLAGVEQVMGPLPAIAHHASLQVRVLQEEKIDNYIRRRITYVPELNSVVHAGLLIPNGAQSAPAALCLHQTTAIGKDEVLGLGGKLNLHYGEELVRRGYVVLAPDYPGFGEDRTDFQRDVFSRGYVSGSMKGIVNHIRGVDLLTGLPEVDARRIAAVGHSLGGHNALFVAAFDRRICAVVTSCGFTSMFRYYGGNLKGWTSDRYMPRIASIYHNSPKELPFDFPDILAVIAPRAIFVNAPVSDSNFDLVGVDECVGKSEKSVP